jgi:WD40 repeat protein
MRVTLLLALGCGCVTAARAVGATMPPGTLLAYTVLNPADADSRIYLHDVRLHIDQQLHLVRSTYGLGTWINSHELLLTQFSRGYMMYRFANTPNSAALFSAPQECRSNNLTGSNPLYACASAQRGLYVFDPCIVERCNLAPDHLIPESLVQTWVWSPDGTRIVYFDTAPFTAGLAVIDVMTEQVQRVTDSLGAEVPLISWSPDATRLAYYVLEPQGRTLQVYDLETETVALHLTLDVLVSQEPPQWSPDGTMLAYTTSQTHRIMLVDVTTGEMTEMINRVARQPRWSPDGRWIAYSIEMGQDAGIHLFNVETGETQPLALFDPLIGDFPGTPYAWRPCPESVC